MTGTATTGTLTDPVAIGSSEAPSRVVFGPHETNLARGRALSDRHVAYYARRAAGGAGVIITETASVTDDDWPYERAPAAAASGAGWRGVADACHRSGSLVLAGLGHAGGQGSSAYSQSVMWAPSRVADVVSREPPAELDADGIADVVRAFARAADAAVGCGLDGVEIDSGAFSLLRQFQSGLTNVRGDDYGVDRLRFTREVLAAVRAAIGPGAVLGLRLACDELAPWAGITPEQAADAVAVLAPRVDLLTVVRAGPYATGAYRPDAHTPASTNEELCRTMRAAAAGAVPVVLQGSVVEPAAAAAALGSGVADLVEMTRAQIAEPRLVARLRAGRPELVRPCILCNQTCRVRDNRNPIVTCVGEPSAGHETDDPGLVAADPSGPEPTAGSGSARSGSAGSGSAGSGSAGTGPAGPGSTGPGAGGRIAGPPVLVVGGGPAGLECARVLAGAGRPVRLAERSDRLGGTAAAAAIGPGRARLAGLTDWLAAECARLGVDIVLGTEVTAADVAAARAQRSTVVLATGSIPVVGRFDTGQPPEPVVVDALAVFGAGADGLPPGPVVVSDPVGDQVGVAVSEWLAGAGRSVTLVAPDPVAGTLLARTGDLADANVRLQRAGVTRCLHTIVRAGGNGAVLLEDVWTAERVTVPAAVLIDCGHRQPDDRLYRELADPALARAGDCVAPRTIHEAVLEGRRVALAMAAGPMPAGATR